MTRGCCSAESTASLLCATRRIALAAAGCVCIALGLAACHGGGMPSPGPGGGSVQNATAWGMAGGGPQRQGLSAYSGPDTPEIAWEYVLDGELLRDPRFDAEGNIYIVAQRTLLSFSLGGDIRWRYSRHGRLYTATYLAADDSVRAVFDEPSIACLNPDGTERWVYGGTGAASFYTAMFTEDGRTYVIERYSSSNDRLVCIDPDGIIQWTIDDSPVTTVYDARPNFIYGSNADSKLVVLDGNGSLRWQLPQPEGLPPNFEGSEPYGGAYVTLYKSAGEDSVLAHFDSNGDETWAYTVVDRFLLDPFIDRQGFVYLRESDGTLTIIDPDGTVAHTAVKINYIAGMDDDGLVYAIAPTEDGKSLISLNPAGQVIEEYRGAPDNLGIPAISNLGYLATNSRYIGATENIEGLHVWDLEFNHLWQYATHGRNTYSMLLDSQGNIYLSSISEIGVVNSSGLALDQLAFENRVQDSLAIGPRGSMYYCDQYHVLFALSTSGSPQWEAQLGGRGSPHDLAVTEGGFYIPSDFLLFALDSQGETNYVFAAETTIRGGPAVAQNGTVCLMDRNHNAYVLGTDGKERWRLETSGANWDYPVIAGKNQVLLSADHGMVALDLNGSQLWALYVEEGTVDPTPAVGPDGTIYAPIRYDPEDSLEGAPGSQQQLTGSRVFREGTVSRSSADVSESLSDMVTLENPDTPGLCALAADGQISWYLHLDEGIYSQPVVDSRGRIYTLSSNGTASAISKQGELVWAVEIPNVDGASGGFMALSPQNRLIVFEGGVVSAVGP